jgi:glycosyltransferase involved in cell wall biosynthesis
MFDIQTKVSIITPVYNRAGIVHKTIESVIDQAYQNWELLIVDDGSSDNIEEVIAKKYGSETRIRFLRREREPKSASTCRNIGAEKATGSYLIFLDSDDMLEPYCLEQRINVMSANPELNMAIFRFRFLNHMGGYTENNFNNGLDPLINFLSNKSYWAILCPIWKKSFFMEIGGFNEYFPRYQDPEIHIRALTHPGIKYRQYMHLPPDTIVIPSVKVQSVQFALNTHASLCLLVPQTHDCLVRSNRASEINLMEGYLKDWLKFFAHANFINILNEQCSDLLYLFFRYSIISQFRFWIYRKQLSVARVLVKIVRYAYLKLVDIT